MTGTLSYHAIGLPHWGHIDRPETTSPFLGSLCLTTFKKLPITQPNTVMKTISRPLDMG
jgi:hypothetical protein